MGALVIILLGSIFGCNAATVNWVAFTHVPIRIGVDNFSALCVINKANVTTDTVFQWANGTNIKPQTNRYGITLNPLSTQALTTVILNTNISFSNWTMSANSSNLWRSSTDGNTWYAMITISYVEKDEVGGLLCGNQSFIKLDSYPYAEVDAARSVIQGDAYEMTCNPSGSPLPSVVIWFKDDQPLAANSRVQVISTNSTINATVRFTPAEYEDDGTYLCLVHNVYGVSDNSTTIVIRVKDRWAALWPFLGIVAEVIVLCTIILLCERRQHAKLTRQAEDDRNATEKVNDVLIAKMSSNADEKSVNDSAIGTVDDVRQRPIVKS